jgi:hypothetical protein
MPDEEPPPPPPKHSTAIKIGITPSANYDLLYVDAPTFNDVAVRVTVTHPLEGDIEVKDFI